MSEPNIGYIKSDGLVEVQQVHYYPPRDGKKSFIRVGVSYREFYGGRGNSATYATRIATLLAFNEVADRMQELVQGDLVVFDHARPNAGLPYKNAKGEMSSTPEHTVQSWYKVGHVERPGDSSPEKASGKSPAAIRETLPAFAASAQAHDHPGKNSMTPGDFETEDEAYRDPFADD